MARNNDLDVLFEDAELPFGHPGHNFDDTSADFDNFDDGTRCHQWIRRRRHRPLRARRPAPLRRLVALRRLHR